MAVAAEPRVNKSTEAFTLVCLTGLHLVQKLREGAEAAVLKSWQMRTRGRGETTGRRAREITCGPQ